ncbi:hypothetical protein AB0B50_25815 [Streptomyces sp. NPDC041068]|uniref:hypothetical protein n=1 Tax=Streptomyces sp. NPDC041068 TaxID=3155130 RepID=UPI0033F9C895
MKASRTMPGNEILDLAVDCVVGAVPLPGFLKNKFKSAIKKVIKPIVNKFRRK